MIKNLGYVNVRVFFREKKKIPEILRGRDVFIHAIRFPGQPAHDRTDRIRTMRVFSVFNVVPDRVLAYQTGK